MKSDRRQSGLLKLLLAFSLLPFLIGTVNAEQFHFTILHTSDEHSSLIPIPLVNYRPGEADRATGGYSRIATVIKNVRSRKTDTPVLLFCSGDFIGGTPFSWLILKDRSPELEIMQSLDYNATTIGNHEFDYGSQGLADYLIRLSSNGRSVPVISSNMIVPENHDINRAGIKKNILINLSNGLKVGVFALLGQGAYRVSPDAKPLKFADQLQTAGEQVATLKAQNAQLIIALTHAGITEDRVLAESVDGIDLILGGHDHLPLRQPEQVGNTLIMHSGYYTQSIGQLDLTWESKSGVIKLYNQETGSPVLHEINSVIAEDPETKTLIAGYLKELNNLIASFTGNEFTDVSHIIARSEFEIPSDVPFTESATGNFVTDAMRIECSKATGEKVDFAFQANGVIRGRLMSGTDTQNQGKISLFDLISISSMGSGPDKQPGYPMVSLYLTGEEIYRLLEISSLLPQLWGDIYFLQFSGLRYTYDPERTFWIRQIPWLNKPLPAYASVLSADRLKDKGETAEQDVYEPLEPDNSRLYHLVTTSYLATYLPMIGSRLPRLALTIKNRQGQQISLDDAIIRENGRELKVWEATARHCASFARGRDNLPVIPERYRKTEGRINVGKGPWLLLWPLVAITIAITLAGVFFMSFRRRRKKKQQPD